MKIHALGIFYILSLAACSSGQEENGASTVNTFNNDEIISEEVEFTVDRSFPYDLEIKNWKMEAVVKAFNACKAKNIQRCAYQGIEETSLRIRGSDGNLISGAFRAWFFALDGAVINTGKTYATSESFIEGSSKFFASEALSVRELNGHQFGSLQLADSNCKRNGYEYTVMKELPTVKIKKENSNELYYEIETPVECVSTVNIK